MTLLIVGMVALLGLGVGLQAWRWSDRRRAARAWRNLVAEGRGAAAAFDPATVQHLPEPARRYLLFTISPRAIVRTVSEISMTGELGLGSQQAPNYVPMRATQILAPPYGLVWNLRAGRGLLRIDGSDGCFGSTSWTRFWLMKAIPIVRVGGSADHARAAFGRVVAEAVFWAPAALLPGAAVSWESVGPNIARATVRHRGMVQTVDVTVAADGQPTTVVIPRWSNANPEKIFRLQPFGGFLSAFRDFDGYRLPTRVDGGNFIGTDAYFPFYKAQVEAVRFVGTR